jgi:hypothetical protein
MTAYVQGVKEGGREKKFFIFFALLLIAYLSEEDRLF